MAEQIKNDMVVGISYILRDGEGNILDQADASSPLEYLHGHQNIIPGLENELTGLAIGDKKKVTVSPEDGYGEHHEGLVIEVPKDRFPADFPMQPGIEFETDTPNGRMVFRIVSIGEEEVKVDGNHPLAGETLHFEVEVQSLRQPTAQETEHGHVHRHGHDH